MQKKYKSKVSFTKKKGKKTIKYKNGARVQESTFDTPLRGTTAPITSTGFQVMDDTEGNEGLLGNTEKEGTAQTALNVAATVAKALPEGEGHTNETMQAANDTGAGLQDAMGSIPVVGQFTDIVHGVTDPIVEKAQSKAQAVNSRGVIEDRDKAIDGQIRASFANPFKALSLRASTGNWGVGKEANEKLIRTLEAPGRAAFKESEGIRKNNYLASVGEAEVFKNGGKMKDTKSYSVGGMLGESTKRVNEDKNYVANNLTGYNKKYTHIVNNPDKYTTEEFLNATNVIQDSFPSDAKSIKTADNISPYPNTARTTTFSNGGKNHSATIKLDSELTKFFGPSHKDGGIKLGTNSKGQKIEVEGGETAKDGFIHSDNIGYTKSGEPTPDAKKTATTFASKAKQIENKFKGRTDAISNITKKRLYDKVEKDNTKVGPIADAMEGNPQTEGKFENGKFVNGKWVKGEETDFTAEMDFSTTNRPDTTKLLKPIIQKEFNYEPQTNFKKDAPTGLLKNQINKQDAENTGTGAKAAKTTKKTTEKVGLTLGDKIGMAANLPSIARNMQLGLSKPEAEALRLNSNAKKVENLMANRKINMQSLQNKLTGERTAGMKAIGENTRGVGSRNANLQNLFANSAQKKAELEMKSQDVNNKYRGEEANTLNSLGAQEAAERIRQQTVNSQNKAFKTNAMTDAFTGLSKTAADSSKILNTNSENNMTLASVNALSTKYKVEASVVNGLIAQGFKNKDLDAALVKYKKNKG